MRPRCPLLLLLLLGAASARRADPDFEFEDADADVERSDGAPPAPRPRRYVYDPHNPLCRALVCKKREVCLLRDASTALCANNKDVLRKGDVIVSGGADDGADDVFYDAGPAARDAAPAPGRCVGCGGARAGGFLCGSDNRTYSSLCRLDLHNCVRRGAPPVALACRGFCPCRRSRPEWRRRKSEAQAHNEVSPERPSRRRLSQDLRPAAAGAGCALDKMADRLLDWFSVLMRGAPAPARGAFPPGCKPEVRWMFAHLDADGDGALDAAELYALRHDERERCLRPFLASCGGARVRRGAWCACLARAARPCTALARAARAGGVAPACDARGFYRPRQCHAALGVCWCVDAHGAERPGSRVRGEPRCGPRAPADDEDGAGSGDAELRS